MKRVLGVCGPSGRRSMPQLSVPALSGIIGPATMKRSAPRFRVRSFFAPVGLTTLLGALWVSYPAAAQIADSEDSAPASDPGAAEEGEPSESAAAEADDPEDLEGEEPRLRRPAIESLQLQDLPTTAESEADEPPADETLDDDVLPSPAEAQRRLEEGMDSDPTVSRWTTPQTVVDLHGYLRFRGAWQDMFHLNRVVDDPVSPSFSGAGVGRTDLPFALFRPLDDGATPDGGCGGDGARCDQNANAFGNMRLRLEPSIHLSDDVRIRMQVDVFDNMVLGSTPDAYVVGLSRLSAANPEAVPYYRRYSRTTFAPYEFATGTLVPPSSGVNSLTDSIVARRAWAEVRNRGLGELRFGRMGAHWGLGLVANGGEGIDSDYQTDVDRVMLITRLAGVYLFGAWDFAGEGLTYQEIPDLGGVPFDRSRLDDVDQFVVGSAYRLTDEEEEAALQRGDAVINVGAYFQWRTQNLSSYGTQNPFNLCIACDDSMREQFETSQTFNRGSALFVRRGAEAYIPDLWAQFKFGKLRLEVEAAMVIGSIENLESDLYDRDSGIDLLQFGFAFEGEYRLLNDQLGIYFNAGYASGDSDVEGLNRIGGLQQPGNEDRTYSTFYFHPNYRVDLIFWRTIMRQVGGAYYFRPGLSYDFIRNTFGQLLGARADVIWSRASEAVQSWGNADDLGVEINASIYYRSEDGPELLDGFYAQLQYGIFFPLDGLGFLPGEVTNPPSLANAQTFRLLLGVQY